MVAPARPRRRRRAAPARGLRLRRPATRRATAVTVVATTTQAADLARQVAGDRARVVGLLPPGADPHDHEVRPDDVKALAGAALVVRSGGELDAWLEGAVESSGTERADAHADRRTCAHAARRPALVAGPAQRDPRRRSAARRARARRSRRARRLRAPARAPTTRRLRGARRAPSPRCLQRLPAAERKLVTTHDSLGYYAAPLRPRGRRRGDPVAVHAGPAVGGRHRRARSTSSGASASRRSSPRAR